MGLVGLLCAMPDRVGQDCLAASHPAQRAWNETGQTRAAVRLAQVAAFASFYAGTAAMAVIGKWA